ncbi:MAG: GFA family protein [Proteobacteria bacterium]|nr:GFA family protein [Pseudomonadota bacterium]
MSDSGRREGSCLCGAVALTVESFDTALHACHCNMCRKWGGGPFLAIDCGKGIGIDGREFVAAFDSSEWAQRGFCSRCGTHLFYRLKNSDHYVVPVGFFDDDSGVSFASQIFIDEKPEYYAFANETAFKTGAEVFAKYAPGPE